MLVSVNKLGSRLSPRIRVGTVMVAIIFADLVEKITFPKTLRASLISLVM